MKQISNSKRITILSAFLHQAYAYKDTITGRARFCVELGEPYGDGDAESFTKALDMAIAKKRADTQEEPCTITEP